MHTDKGWGILGQGLAVLTLIATLAGCGGASDASSSNGAAAAPQIVGGATPSVAGNPLTMVAANDFYSFRPTGASASGKPLSYSIENKPNWASFSLATGELSGTPSLPDTGKYSHIVIGASDGTGSTALPAFSIQVIASNRVAGTSSSSSSSGSSSSGSTSHASSSGSTSHASSSGGAGSSASASHSGGSSSSGGTSSSGSTIHSISSSSSSGSSSSGATSHSGSSSSSSSSSSSGASGAGTVSGQTAALLNYVTGLTNDSRHILVGQHSGYWDSNPMAIVSAVFSQTGTYPAILGTTLGIAGTQEDGVALSNQWLAKGGIVESRGGPPIRQPARQMAITT